MTLKETIYESSHGVIGVNFILHRKYYDDRWNGERDGYMEVEIIDYHKGGSNDDALVKFLVKTSLQGHRVGDIEWHDMTWCSQWEVITTVSQFPI
jgi:hypothetical protein